MENIQEVYSRKQNLNSYSTTRIKMLCIYLEEALYERKTINFVSKKAIIFNFEARDRRYIVKCLPQSTTNHGK